MESLRVNVSIDIEGQDGCEGDGIFFARVEDGAGVYLVTNEVDSMPLTKVENVDQCLPGVTFA